MDVGVLLEPRIDLPRLAEVLEGLGHEGRVHTVRGWKGKTLAALFEAAKGHMPLALDFLVPADVPPMVEVVHEGKNSLPLFSHFEKRFCRPPQEPQPPALWGHNHQAMSVFTGPGYFVVHEAEGGELAFDYEKLPPSKLSSWPALVSNHTRLGPFVYAHMIDHLRGISGHVSVGRVAKKGKLMDTWFALVRKDPEASARA